jgi:hypothetical protein
VLCLYDAESLGGEANIGVLNDISQLNFCRKQQSAAGYRQSLLNISACL